jgi:choline dehydrogenase-like flavoprotein
VWHKRDPLLPIPFRGGRVVTRVAQIVDPLARSFRVAYRNDLDAATNIVVQCNATVTDIETNTAGTLVTRLHAGAADGRRFTVEARTVVLAAGGIENPRILLASNRQWPRGLGNGNDLVGRFFMEHPRFVSGLLVPTDPQLGIGFYHEHHVHRSTIQGYLALAAETQRREGLVDVQMVLRPQWHAAFERAEDSPDFDALHEMIAGLRGRDTMHDFKHHLARVIRDLTTWQTVAIPGAPLPVPFPEVVGELMRSTPAAAQALIPELLGDVAGAVYMKAGLAPLESVNLRTRIDPTPNPDSRVTLGEARDAFGMPRAQLDWRLSALDRHSVRRSLEIVGEEAGRAGIGRVRILLDADERSPWPEDLAGGWHHMGTTRMSVDPRLGVVDPHGRVHGIGNLYVAGSSVFPNAGSGTPTLTIVALALRLAEHLQGFLK